MSICRISIRPSSISNGNGKEQEGVGGCTMKDE